MTDPVYEGFVREQWKQGSDLARQSDLLDLSCRGGNRFVAHFHCKGLVRLKSGEVAERKGGFVIGIWFPTDYLRRVEPGKVLTWLSPTNVWHPNIRPPAICAGRIDPGTELTDLLYQCYEIITYFNWAAHDALHQDAAQWARNHQHLIPIDRRPLKRRTLNIQVVDEVKTR